MLIKRREINFLESKGAGNPDKKEGCFVEE